jgi:DNA (cytosine-5)-methyltransferase 1
MNATSSGGHDLQARPFRAEKLTEWMMCWPDGWVTDVPGVNRTEAIRVCGNGVVIPQAQAAVRYLLALAPDGKDACLAPGRQR